MQQAMAATTADDGRTEPTIYKGLDGLVVDELTTDLQASARDEGH